MAAYLQFTQITESQDVLWTAVSIAQTYLPKLEWLQQLEGVRRLRNQAVAPQGAVTDEMVMPLGSTLWTHEI